MSAEEIWRCWVTDQHYVSRIPEARYPDALNLIAHVLNQLNDGVIKFVDVGCARGDVFEILRSGTGLSKPLYSIGIDPIDHRCRGVYDEFLDLAILDDDRSTVPINVHAESSCSSVQPMITNNVVHHAAESNGLNYFAPKEVVQIVERRIVKASRLSRALAKTAVSEGIIHFLKIDSQGVDLDVFNSLGTRSMDVLFVQLETIIREEAGVDTRLYQGQTSFEEDVRALQAAGFRVVNIADFVITPEADVVYVNTSLLEGLLPGFSKAAAMDRA